MTVSDIQHALMIRGFDPGVIDGFWGRRTAKAVRLFQQSRGITPDGVVGPVTAKALGLVAETANPLANPALVWLQEALRLSGVREAPGAANNPKILQWAAQAGIPYAGDDIPWCGLFVAHCIGSALNEEPLPVSPLSARSWLKFGAPTTGQAGAVAVFWRGAPTGWQGHVAFYLGEDKEAYHVLGGNQSDAVNVARIAKDRLLAFRWPATVPPGSGKPVPMTKGGKLSNNEA